jgi:hypothetical protein
MASKYMKCSASLAIKDANPNYIKISSHPVRMAISKDKNNNKC